MVIVSGSAGGGILELEAESVISELEAQGVRRIGALGEGTPERPVERRNDAGAFGADVEIDASVLCHVMPRAGPLLALVGARKIHRK